MQHIFWLDLQKSHKLFCNDNIRSLGIKIRFPPFLPVHEFVSCCAKWRMKMKAVFKNVTNPHTLEKKNALCFNCFLCLLKINLDNLQFSIG